MFLPARARSAGRGGRKGAVLGRARNRQRSGVADDPLADIKSRLHNWARWSHVGVMPDLQAKLSSLWSQWLPRQAWDAGWGDLGAPEEPPASIRNEDAIMLDRLILRLPVVHRRTIVLHYYDREGQRRDRLDEACRALNDLLP